MRYLLAMLLVGIVLALVVSLGRASDPGTARAALPSTMDDVAGTLDFAEVVQFPEIFIGRVTDEIGEHNVSECGGAFMAPLFAVDVERTIYGTATGRVEVAVYTSEFADLTPAVEVTVGHRYLFASDVPDASGAYSVTGGFDAIEIGSSEGAKAIEAEVRRLRESGSDSASPVSTPTEPCG